MIIITWWGFLNLVDDGVEAVIAGEATSPGDSW